MKSSLLLTLFALLLLQACKKDDEADSPPSISFSSTGGYTLNLPLTVVFTANSPGAESISWDFGDGTFGQGFSVQHSYTAYGNYKVKATASKAGLSSTYIRDLPVTFH
ncbi:MAG: PKD domain-containing protein, partial [Bacteroidia bacterium]|nr:PKD domain-containing protein [Bacteroidia bacterium]